MYISSRSAKDCEATAAELCALGPGTCIAVPANLANYDDVEALAKELVSREKMVHVLVNNAGAAWGATLDEFPVSLSDTDTDSGSCTNSTTGRRLH